jgi:hypothetical protein
VEERICLIRVIIRIQRRCVGFVEVNMLQGNRIEQGMLHNLMQELGKLDRQELVEGT